MTELKQQIAIDNIMDAFDFAKVQKTMRLLNWTWATDHGKEVPDETELRMEARRLLKEAIAHKTIIATGGFWAEYKEWKDGSVNLSLKFVVTEWDEDIE
jgi:hypothetical protein